MKTSSHKQSSKSSDALQTIPILKILEAQVVPWIHEFGMERLVIASRSMNDVLTVPDTQVSPKKRRGKRIVKRRGSKDEPLPVISAHWPDDEQIELRTPQLLCVVSGSADIHLSNYILHCPQGYLVLIPPGVPFPNTTTEPHLEGKNRLHGACDIMWCSLHRRRLQLWVCHSHKTQHQNPRLHENIIITDSYPASLLEGLSEALSEYKSVYHDLYKALLLALLLSVSRNISEQRFIFVGPDDSNVSLGDSFSEVHSDPISHACQYINDHLHENLTIEKVAQKMYMSRARFAKRFHEETGRTFNEYTTHCRLKQAERLLRETDYSITYISRLIGYKSVPHLYELFTCRYKTTPLRFREKAKMNKK